MERLLVVQVACPPLLRAWALQVPMVEPPSLKFTVPVGVPAPGATAAIVTVRVTDCPNTDGFTDELTDVVVEAEFTVWVKLLETEVVKFASPE